MASRSAGKLRHFCTRLSLDFGRRCTFVGIRVGNTMDCMVSTPQPQFLGEICRVILQKRVVPGGASVYLSCSTLLFKKAPLWQISQTANRTPNLQQTVRLALHKLPSLKSPI